MQTYTHPEHYDVIVVGGGHAGVEAALASARMGTKTLLITHNIETIGQMSCNPSMGGIGKGHLMKEVDALGGVGALATDHAGIQWRILNRSKGPAVQATRAQNDRLLYKAFVRQTVENQANLDLFQQPVDDVLIEGGRAVGVITQSGLTFRARAIVLTAGTFQNGKVHIGLDTYTAGRAADPASLALAGRLRELNLPTGRLKTGTPPRIDGRTIDFSLLEEQAGDGVNEGALPVFSFMGKAAMHPAQMSCYMTATNEQTHDILRAGFDRSAYILQKFEGPGPRYCPSIEDKITRFSDKNSHQVYLEPEGLTTHEYYPNGISTSLPFDVQLAAVRSMVGLANAKILRPGYAIEYDYYLPSAFSPSLESRTLPGLFVGGQLLGSTGYEEAMASGIVAGINAASYAKGTAPVIFDRSQSYIGVLIDDLTTKTLTEPYRMFTSRAEFRLTLREDNADERLTPLGRTLGLVDDARWGQFNRKMDAISTLHTALSNTFIAPVHLAQTPNAPSLSHESALSALVARPDQTMGSVQALCAPLGGRFDAAFTALAGLDEALGEQVAFGVQTRLKYAGYIERQNDEAQKMQQYERLALPKDFDYMQISALSTETKQKLNEYRPQTLGQASRIAGVPPAAVSLILVYLKKNRLMMGDASPIVPAVMNIPISVPDAPTPARHMRP